MRQSSGIIILCDLGECREGLSSSDACSARTETELRSTTLLLCSGVVDLQSDKTKANNNSIQYPENQRKTHPYDGTDHTSLGQSGF